MLAVRNFAQAQNLRQAISCRCKISRSQLRSVEFLAVQMEAQNLCHATLHGITPAQIPMPHVETHNLISLQDRLRNSTTSLVT